MSRDELRQPLRKPTVAEQLLASCPNPLVLACLIAIAVFTGAGVWIASLPYPFAGEPMVVASIPPVTQIQTAKAAAKIEPAPEVEAVPETEAEPVLLDPAFDERQPDSGQDEPRIIFAARRSLKPAPVAIILEKTPDGPLPRIAKNGKKPSEIYAQTIPLSIMASEKPKIAILLGGMGLNDRLTTKATKQLPADVSFGFAPYGNDLQSKVNAARAEGHEVMLQLPMEPVSYPTDNPGPNTLLADASPSENIKALRWSMSRFAGYTGITNYLGSRFLATPDSLNPVLTEVKSRGLVFLEDASVALTASLEVSRVTGLRSRRADIAIDATAEAVSIRSALAQLEAVARSSGLAVGTGSGLEITIDTIIEWADELEAKGIILVPMSAAYQGNLT